MPSPSVCYIEALEPRVLMSAVAIGSPEDLCGGHSVGCGCPGCSPIVSGLDSGEEVTDMLFVDEDGVSHFDGDGHDHSDEFYWASGGEEMYTDASGYVISVLPEAYEVHEDDVQVSAVADLQFEDDFELQVGATAEGDGGDGPQASSGTIPILHSNPGAAATLYLDFDGHFEAQWGAYSNAWTPAYDIDGDTSTFSSTELSRIQEIWARVAEDYAPFDIDVTTENPGSFDNKEALRVAIGGSSYDWYGKGAGGVAYVNTFTNSIVNTVYVFTAQLANGWAKYVAEAVSHESGHGFGLLHQSTWNGETKTSEYNTGGGGWAPIMGNSYYENQTLWHDGRASNGNYQDDMALISRQQNGFGYRADDHGDSKPTSTALALMSPTSVSGSGIIAQTSDVDVFEFSTGAGLVSFNVNVAQIGANLDVRLELYDEAGTLITSANPSSSQSASLSTNLAEGTYYLHVASAGAYGEVGQYSISGTIVQNNGDAVGPEVTVTLGAQNIDDGQAGAIDFGAALVGQSGPTRIFTVRNDGDQTLNLSQLSVPAGYTIIEGLSSSINAGQSDMFTVRLDTVTAGVKSGQISFTTNDADENPFNFSITGTVNLGPEVTVLLNTQNISDGQVSAIDFGSVLVGQAGPNLTFSVRNDGDQTLNLSQLSAPAGYTVVEGLSSSLNAGQSDTFTVRLDSTAAGVKSGQISFTTNDADENPFNFSITGQVFNGPEVTVLLSGQNIDDGQASAINFGTVVVGQSGPTRIFTVRNDGDQTLTLGSLSLPSGFSVVEGLSSSLAAGASDTFTVRLDSTAVGVKSGQISFTTNDSNENPFNFSITGTVASGPEVTVLLNGEEVTDGQFNAIDFGSALVGQSGPTHVFTVRNDGDQTLTLGSLSLPGGFTLLEGLSSSLAAGQADTFTVQMNTASAGAKSGQISFTTNDTDENPFNFSISGNVYNGPEVTVLLSGQNIADGQANAVDFGTAQVGQSGPTRTFTVRNDGDQTLTLGSLSLPGGFSIVEGLASSLAAGASDTFTIRLDTTSAGQYDGQLSFATNDSDENPFNFSLSGTVVIGPEITVWMDGNELTDGQLNAVDFGTALVGQNGPTRVFTVRNDGDQTLTLGSLSLPSGFTLVEGLSSSLAAGASDTFTVQLSTATAGAKSGQISFTTNDSDENPFNFSISGNVYNGPEVTVLLNGQNIADGQTNPVNFGTVLVGQSGPTHVFTVRNDGDQTLTLGALSLPSGFSVVEGLTSSLAAGASDTFTVRLNTTTTGVKSGQISFPTNDSDESPFNFAITGTVVVGPEVTVWMSGNELTDGQANAVDFGTVDRFGDGPTQMFTVRNDGDQTLTLSNLSVPGGYSIVEGLGSSLAAGASDTFTVRLDTATAGVKSGQITFTTNDADEGTFNFSITGTVVEVADAYEENDSKASVDAKTEGATNSANLGLLSDVKVIENLNMLDDNTDWFRFRMLGTGMEIDFVRLDFDAARGNLELYVYESDGTSLVGSSIGSGGAASVSLQNKQAGVYYVKVVAAAGTANPDYTLTIDPSDAAVRGFGGREKASYYDSDGTLVTVSLRGEGSGFVIFGEGGTGDALRIILNDTTERSSLTIRTSGGDTTVGEIIVHGSLRSLSAKTTNLTGDLTADGAILRIDLADVDGAEQQTISIGGSDNTRASARISLGHVADLSIVSGVAINQLYVQSWTDNNAQVDSVDASSLNRLRSYGAFAANVTLTDATQRTTLGRADVAGLASGVWSINGHAGNVKLGASSEQWQFLATGDVRGLSSTQDMLGKMSASTFNRISAKGRMEAQIDATGMDRRGYSISRLDADQIVETVITAAGGVNSIRAGQWMGGSLDAGMLNSLRVSGNMLADMNLTDPTVRYTLGRVTIGGQILGGQWMVNGASAGVRSGGASPEWHLLVNGEMRSLDVRGDLLGQVTMQSVGSVQVRGLLDADLTILGQDSRGNSIRSFRADAVGDATVTAPGAIGSVRVGTWNDGAIIGASLRSLSVSGDFGADLTLDDSSARATLGRTTVRGTISGGTWNINGRTSAIRADQTMADWQLTSSGDLDGVQTSGNLGGTIVSQSMIKNIRAGVDLNASIYAYGVDSRGVSIHNITADHVGSPMVMAKGQIRSIRADSWGDGVLTAESIGSSRISGAFDADLQLTGASEAVGESITDSSHEEIDLIEMLKRKKRSHYYQRLLRVL